MLRLYEIDPSYGPLLKTNTTWEIIISVSSKCVTCKNVVSNPHQNGDKDEGESDTAGPTHHRQLGAHLGTEAIKVILHALKVHHFDWLL